MMRSGSSPRLVICALLFSVALGGCASLPLQEVSDARQAIDAARAAGGERYTPETLREAESLIDRALGELSAGDYRAARSAALSAKRRAILAREASLSVQAPR